MLIRLGKATPYKVGRHSRITIPKHTGIEEDDLVYIYKIAEGKVMISKSELSDSDIRELFKEDN